MRDLCGHKVIQKELEVFKKCFWGTLRYIQRQSANERAVFVPSAWKMQKAFHSLWEKHKERQLQRNKRCGARHTVVGDRFRCSLLCIGVPLLVLWLPGVVNFKPAVELLSAGGQQLDVWRRQDQKIRQKKYWQLLQLHFRDVHRFENWRTWKNRELGRICVKVIFKQRTMNLTGVWTPSLWKKQCRPSDFINSTIIFNNS